MPTRYPFAVLLAVAACISTPPSAANDSSAAFGLGGLELRRNSAISLDSEELTISAGRITVKYRFTNTSAQDVRTLVAFPLPPLPPDDNDLYLGDAGYPLWSDLHFQTRVNGVPVTLDRVDSATLNGKPIDARLKQLGWPMRWFDRDGEFVAKVIVPLPKPQIDKYVAEGLLLRKPDDPDHPYPAWKVTTAITRTQLFPAGKTITVEHSYAPVSGGSVSGALEKEYRKQTLPAYREQYCVDDAFMAAFDRGFIKYGIPGGRYARYSEIWLAYLLKPGANWKGPIKDFRLIVDTGKPDNLVSFCGSGITKVSPTRFEMHKTDFEPDRDLDILIIKWGVTGGD